MMQRRTWTAGLLVVVATACKEDFTLPAAEQFAPRAGGPAVDVAPANGAEADAEATGGGPDQAGGDQDHSGAEAPDLLDTTPDLVETTPDLSETTRDPTDTAPDTADAAPPQDQTADAGDADALGVCRTNVRFAS